ncbi:MAG TPA: PLP-dependent transferase, partial [Streptosporangiaceae bacterium]
PLSGTGGDGWAVRPAGRYEPMEQRPQGTSLSPETLAAQALGEVDPVSGGLTPAIHPSTNYEQQPDGAYRQDRVYTRADNPTYEPAEGLLAALEGAGCACALFASGMAAATAVFQALLPGDHVLVSRVLYWGVRKWLAEFALSWGPALQAVLYPGLASHPGHQIAARQMRGGFGGMLSIRLVGGAEQAMAVLGAVRVFKRATSLGGVESLIEHRRSQEGPSSPVPDDLLRLSIGIEAPEDHRHGCHNGLRLTSPAPGPVPHALAARRPAAQRHMRLPRR